MLQAVNIYNNEMTVSMILFVAIYIIMKSAPSPLFFEGASQNK